MCFKHHIVFADVLACTTGVRLDNELAKLAIEFGLGGVLGGLGREKAFPEKACLPRWLTLRVAILADRRPIMTGVLGRYCRAGVRGSRMCKHVGNTPSGVRDASAYGIRCNIIAVTIGCQCRCLLCCE